MARPASKTEDKIVETWESVIAGMVWVWIYDRREDRYIKQSVGGTGTKRLHITRDDRKFNQEQVPVENKDLDPFTNGALRFINAASRDETLDIRYHYTDEELGEFFAIRDPDMFIEGVRAIESELIMRRLSEMAEQVGTVAQNEAVKELLRERYPIGGSQRTVREMMAAGEASESVAIR